MYAWLVESWELLLAFFGKGIAQFIALVLFAFFVLIGNQLLQAVRWLLSYHRRLDRALASVQRKATPTGQREGRGIWLTEPISDAKPDEFKTRLESSRVLVVANAKGGVGKTTTAANLGARFAEILPLPVLLIDLDFQGTLSSMTIAKREFWVPPEGSDSKATQLISGDLTSQHIASETQSAVDQPKLKIITSFYDLAQAENRVMIEWLLGDRKADIRFRLAHLLHAPAVRNAFSLIIIDSPPRLTTGAVQALAAGTHLLIPTVMDEPSTEAVVTFVRQVETFRKVNLCPYIKYVGVVGALKAGPDNIEAAQQRLKDRLGDPLENGGAGSVVKLLPEKTYIPRSKYFRKAVSSGGIAYITMGNSADAKEVKDAIVALADHVKQEMKL